MSGRERTREEQAVCAQLMRLCRGHIGGQEFWDLTDPLTLPLPDDHPAVYLRAVLYGLAEARELRGELTRGEQLAAQKRLCRLIPIREGRPRTARQHRRRARKVRRHEVAGTIWRMRRSQYVLGATHGFPARDPTLPLTIEDCGTLWRMEASGRYRKGQPPTNAAQNGYLTREYLALAAQDAGTRHLEAVRAAVESGRPVPAHTLVDYPRFIPTGPKGGVC